MEGAMSGALLENYTVAEIIKTYQNAGQEPFLYYYRDKDAREIDLILERDETVSHRDQKDGLAAKEIDEGV